MNCKTANQRQEGSYFMKRGCCQVNRRKKENVFSFITTLNKHKQKLVRRDTKAFIMLQFEQVNQILLDDSSAWEPSKSEN